MPAGCLGCVFVGFARHVCVCRSVMLVDYPSSDYASLVKKCAFLTEITAIMHILRFFKTKTCFGLFKR